MARHTGLVCAGWVFAAATVLSSIPILGCNRASPQSRQPEELSFAVSDSLLGPAFVIAETETSVRPPRAFAAVSDSLLSTLRETEPASSAEAGGSPLRTEPGAELAAAFLDSTHQAGLAVFVRRGVAHGDMEYVTAYERGLRDANSGAEVRSGDYVVNGVYVRNFLVSSPSLVQFHLLCFAEGPDATELVYFADRQSYPDLVRTFESSIGTIRQIKKGG